MYFSSALKCYYVPSTNIKTKNINAPTSDARNLTITFSVAV